MKIIVAKDAGYCFGVRDAVNLAYDTARKHGEVYMLGHIVHNEKVVSDLEEAGARVVDSLDDVPAGKPVLFRAHGTTPALWQQAREKGIHIVDATCPLVTEIHEEFRKMEAEGRHLIIIGDHGHDEVVGIASQVQHPIVISTVGEARELGRMKKAGVVSQSTQMIENVQAIIAELMTKVFDLKFVNTICFPTRRNHEQIKQLAEQCDVMIVIGSFTSANSKRLTQLALERNPRSYQVASAEEMNPAWFEGEVDTVGISAGASTPDDIIQSVIDRVKALGQVTEKEAVYE
ncbi:MAG: 4-hydroxy-3-methylbut-2-enyl diphosphate reductase [Candidatus Neomarinimicrobiota bacterium]|nr:MAG: 4-hydroxy-3-methylbut-2-enyl diphosphate reductase [Candidatus Neomarinimicrobiota bacterium]